MSNISKARHILHDMLAWELEAHVSDGIKEALSHMYRNVGFVDAGKPSGLTPKDIERCRELRERGMSLHAIGLRYNTSQGIIGNALRLRPGPT